MYLSLNGVPIGGKLSWKEFAALASRTGFRGVDVMLDPAMADGADSTRRLLRELKLKPAFISLPVEFRKDDATFAATLPKLKPAVEFAAAIGCPRMMTYIMASSDTPKEELRATYLKRFQKARRKILLYRREHAAPSLADHDGGTVNGDCAPQAPQRGLHVRHQVFGK